MMRETGRVLAVNTVPLGSGLAVDVPAGFVSIIVEDSADFSEDGGLLTLNGTVYTYTAVEDDTDTLTLASPTLADSFVGDPVNVWDDEAEAVASETVAMVEVEGGTDNDDALEALVPHTLIPFLAEGIRSYGGEYVSLEWRGGDVFIENVLNREPTLDPSYVPTPAVETGNKVYRGELPPWVNDDAEHADDDGDLWWEVTNLTHEDGSTSQRIRPFIWDGTALRWVDASDPKVDLIAAEVGSNANTLDSLADAIENANETATSARNLASTADGRVSMSDYDPTPEDVSYFAQNPDGSLMLDAEGNPLLLTRNPGSVWYTRTRSRSNLIANPSFETNSTGWAVSGATGARATAATLISGSYGFRIANSAAAVDHFAAYGGITAEPGQTFAATVFGVMESGSGAGSYASLFFLDGLGATLAEIQGDPVDLDSADWRELKAVGTAPDGTASVTVGYHNPNPSAVWLIDGALVEQANYTGRYFDGRSYDSEWTGTPDASTSIMEGGKVISVWELYDNGWVRLDFTGTTIYDSDAGDLKKGTLDPDRIADHSLAMDKRLTNQVRASETLAQGDIVHVWDNNGLFFVRKANATLGYEAHGFVLDNAASGDAVYVYTEGYNPYCEDLSPGSQFLSTTPGEPTGTAPSQAGRTVQRIGFASDETTLHFQPGPPIRLT